MVRIPFGNNNFHRKRNWQLDQKNKKPEVLEGEAQPVVAIRIAGIVGIEVELAAVRIGVSD